MIVRLLLAAVAGAILALLIASFSGSVLGGAGFGTPADDSAEAGFARDMATHHAQAVEMGFVVRDRSTDPELRALAYDIISTQSTQRGIFMGWLQEWGLPQGSTQPRMAWMGMGHAGMTPAPGEPLMHGMASAEELRQLEMATGVDAEIRFLQLMIRHHEGGVIMARAVVARSKRPEVVQMAKAIDSGQTVEIALMKEMLARRGARPLPSIL
ncbi:MAG TPA: DUF305 domain-containing protein [Vicinamibacterales bacterium]|nr:DUF305 domain-containing protein [Vicinamibacterales bacterium]